MSNAFQSNLFSERQKSTQAETPPRRHPLAVRMRPRGLTEVLGQEHLLGPGALLPKLIAADTFGSLLFYGPPGCG
ncbi:MAG: replication-associated recombination protein A, partial [Verrucomicrobiota bacterium]